MDILLDYVFKVNLQEALPIANKNYLRQVAVIVKPKSAVENGYHSITNKSDITTYTDNVDVVQLFNAGLNKVNLAIWDGEDISDLATILSANKNDFFTVLISQDYLDSDIANIYEAILSTAGFKGIIGKTFYDTTSAHTYAIKSNFCAFYGISANTSKNMMYAFGKILSSSSWKSKQYIECPYNDGIVDLGTAESMFENMISFVLSSETYNNRLAFFVAGSQAIIAPYILEELKIDMQAKALNYITLNNPQYTVTESVLLQGEVQKVIDEYISNKLLESGTVKINIDDNSNFVADGNITVSNPTALWRVITELKAV
jgi:hypothetical protein